MHHYLLSIKMQSPTVVCHKFTMTGLQRLKPDQCSSTNNHGDTHRALQIA